MHDTDIRCKQRRRMERKRKNEVPKMRNKMTTIISGSILNSLFGSCVVGNVEYTKWLWGGIATCRPKNQKKKRAQKRKNRNVPNNRDNPSGIKLAHHFPSARHRPPIQICHPCPPSSHIRNSTWSKTVRSTHLLFPKAHRRIGNFTMQRYVNLRGVR